MGDQRGVRLGHAELDPHARHRRGQGQRQRRRGRARPPDRRLAARASSARSCTSCAAAAAASAAPRSARAAARATRSSSRVDGGSGRGRPRTAEAPRRSSTSTARSWRARPASTGRAPRYDAGMISPPPDGARRLGEHALPPRAARPTRRRTALRDADRATARAARAASTSRRLVPEVLAGVLPRSTRRCCAVAYDHQDAGRPRLHRTAASQEMAEHARARARLRRRRSARARRSSTAATPAAPPGRFTYREGKARARCASWPTREGIDLAESYAYSDSESDLPMLRLVGHPVAVNPDAELARIAARGGLGGPALRAAAAQAARRRRAGRDGRRGRGGPQAQVRRRA